MKDCRLLPWEVDRSAGQRRPRQNKTNKIKFTKQIKQSVPFKIFEGLLFAAVGGQQDHQGSDIQNRQRNQ